jgi:hypothetical protein
LITAPGSHVRALTPLPGLRVSPADLATDDDLSGWVEIGIGHARSLPPKQPAKKKPKM